MEHQCASFPTQQQQQQDRRPRYTDLDAAGRSRYHTQKTREWRVKNREAYGLLLSQQREHYRAHAEQMRAAALAKYHKRRLNERESFVAA